MIIVKILTLMTLVQSIGEAWTPKDRELYNSRHFFELSHILIMQNKQSLAVKIRHQERDLPGCRQIHEGHGGLPALFKCAQFLNRENSLQLKTPGSDLIISNLNILCGSLIVKPFEVSEAIATQAFKNSSWKGCNEVIWRQVYLTVYANFETDSVGTLALVRRAQEGLSPNTLWGNRVLSFINQHHDRF